VDLSRNNTQPTEPEYTGLCPELINALIEIEKEKVKIIKEENDKE
jgi:hypothetical protein